MIVVAVVELADTRDLKSLAERHTGSTPVSGTKNRRNRIADLLFLMLRHMTLQHVQPLKDG